MNFQTQAVFKNGVLRPLQPIPLAEHQEVTVTIDAYRDGSPINWDVAHFVLPEQQWQQFCEALDAPPKEIPALRRLLTEPSLFDDKRSSAP